MIAELEDLLSGFSKVNHTRCFLHVNNLVAQTFVRQFDAPVAPKNSNPDDPNHELYQLAIDIDLEERATREALLNEAAAADLEEIAEDDDKDGWVDEMAALSQAEREVMEESLRPVKMLLAKVSASTSGIIGTYFDPRFGNSLTRPSIRQRSCYQHGTAALKS